MDRGLAVEIILAVIHIGYPLERASYHIPFLQSVKGLLIAS